MLWGESQTDDVCSAKASLFSLVVIAQLKLEETSAGHLVQHLFLKQVSQYLVSCDWALRWRLQVLVTLLVILIPLRCIPEVYGLSHKDHLLSF